MLVLTRKTNEEIVIGDNIRITIVEIAPGRVKIGVEAPKTVRVDRAEVHEKKKLEAAGSSPVDVPPVTVAPVVNRLAEQLSSPVDVPTAVIPAGPVVHPLPANRLSALRRRFPKKPR